MTLLGVNKVFLAFTGRCLYRQYSSQLINVSHEVSMAMRNDVPVVALESTIITHGMPYPHNLRTALEVENVVRSKGAMPATIAVVEGRIHVGLTGDILEQLANSVDVVKISRRDFPSVIAGKLSGGTTVAGTMLIASKVGIPIFVTGGIGGVHRGGESSLDISADLNELGRTEMAVVSAGVKSILDIGRTLEYLETLGVTVVNYGKTKEFPCFYSTGSGFHVPWNVETADEAANMIKASRDLGRDSSILFGVPIPKEYAIDHDTIEALIQEALKECKVEGREVTPFLLEKINQLSGGDSLRANQALIKHNASVGTDIAIALVGKKGRQNSKQENRANLPKTLGRPVVIGGSNFDFICRVDTDITDNSTNGITYSGSIRTCLGGVGRNIADVLACLDCNPYFISVIGNDDLGRIMLNTSSFMDKSAILSTARTAAYTAILDPAGHNQIEVGDMRIHGQISPEMVGKHVDKLREAPMIILDANCPQETIDYVLEVAVEAQIPVFYEPTDPEKALKAVQSPFPIKYASPNIHELRSMAGLESKDSVVESEKELLQDCLKAGQVLKSKFDMIIVTLGQYGVLFMDQKTATHYKVEPVKDVVSVSGAGDCFAGAFVAGKLKGMSQDEAVSAGLQVAGMSLQSANSVPLDLTFDRIDLQVIPDKQNVV